MRPFDSYSTKRISFILATKNRARFLEKALDSHKNLIGPKDELIVVDGGSKDQTDRVVKKYERFIPLFVSEPDISEGHANNKGVLLAKGKYVKTLTDDDVFFREGIDKAVEVMENNPEIDVLLCGGIKQRGKKIWYAYAPPGVNYGKDVSDIFKYGGCGLGWLIRRKAFSQTGLFNVKSVSMDNDYLCQALASGAVVKFCRIKMFHHFIEKHSGIVSRSAQLGKDFERIKRQYGVYDHGTLVNFRIKFSQIIFPLLPEAIQKSYLLSKKLLSQRFLEKSVKPKRVNPVWDGGFS